MRGIARFLVLGGVLSASVLTGAQSAQPSGSTAATQASGDAAGVLAAARTALGGEARLAAVKSFVVTGRTRQVRGDNLVPIEFEISCELPDKCVRKDEIPAQESGPTSSGFNGDELIQLPVPAAPNPAGRPGGPPPPGATGAASAGAAAPDPGAAAARLDAMRKARTAVVKQDFARLTFGMFAGSFTSYPLTFTYVGQAEAPQGKADVIDAKGPGNFAVRLFVSSETHLPIMASWQGPPARPGRGGSATPGAARPGAPGAAPVQAAATPQGAPAAQAAPSPPEYRLYYADYRSVDGLMWPFRLRRATGTDTTEETTFDRFRINPKIDPKKFEVRK